MVIDYEQLLSETVERAAKRISELEGALRRVRHQIEEDMTLGVPSERATQSLIMADIDIALSGQK